MPNAKSRWRNAIVAVEFEYMATRFSLDWLLGAAVEEINDVAEANGAAEPPRGAINDAYRYLSATYFIRMFSVFERAILSFWRFHHGYDADGPKVERLIDDVATILAIDYRLIEQAQESRDRRDKVIHRPFHLHAAGLDLGEQMSRLLAYLDRLPPSWP